MFLIPHFLCDTEKPEGAFCLPVRTNAGVTVLISDGFDSPVVVWMLFRGCGITCLHFHSGSYEIFGTMKVDGRGVTFGRNMVVGGKGGWRVKMVIQSRRDCLKVSDVSIIRTVAEWRTFQCMESAWQRRLFAEIGNLAVSLTRFNTSGSPRVALKFSVWFNLIHVRCKPNNLWAFDFLLDSN
jgi:hypothetical protein